MKVPKNMTEQQVIDKIITVVDRMAHKYTFNGYDVEDIKQEAFLICMDALERYDQKRPLENFLSVHLSNRLKNFIRDNYFTNNHNEKKKVLAPSQLAYEDNVLDRIEPDLDINIDSNEIKDLIDKYLPIQYRADYLKMINDISISKNRRTQILSLIKKILKENGYA
jgi:RNA polymerase sigma factor (sigma-70 family)